MPRAKTPPTKSRDFVRMLYLQPLWAVPFALFFGTLMDGSWPRYVRAYWASLVFAYSIGLALWVVQWLIMPRFNRIAEGSRPRPVWMEGAVYASTAMLASGLAATVLHFTLLPGFLGSGRQVLLMGMFSLLFTVLFTGLAYAYHFYQSALERARSEQELNMARRIQRSFLLSQFPDMPRLQVHAVNVSSKEVSGDFYDVVPAGPDAFLVAIADVAGKGVPAALLSSMLQASLRTQATTVSSVSAILRNINALVYRSTAVSQFATFFLARVDEHAMTLAFSNAGHNFPIVFRRDGSRATLERGGTVVGILEEATFDEGTIDLRAGDRILLYTDGISEAANAHGELFGEERLERLVQDLPHDLSASELVERILGGVREFLAGVEPGDDMTVLALRVLEDGASPPTTRA